MKKHTLFRFGLSFVSAVALCSVSGTASADGLKSQNKSHVPSAPGLVQTLTPSQKKMAHGAPIVNNPVSDQEIIGIIFRRNLRASKRREKWFGVGSEVTPEAKAELISPVNSGNRVDRARLIKRGNQALPSKCSMLHTHDRATCLYESQLQKMLRFEVSER